MRIFRFKGFFNMIKEEYEGKCYMQIKNISKLSNEFIFSGLKESVEINNKKLDENSSRKIMTSECTSIECLEAGRN